jgi:alpha-tubulin suppressor-like RCC1 family protein
VKCWGSNGYGEAPANRTTADGVAYTQVDAGDYHTCAMRADDLVECWGYNNHGQSMSEQGISFKTHATTAQIGDIVRIEKSTGTVTSLDNLSNNASTGRSELQILALGDPDIEIEAGYWYVLRIRGGVSNPGVTVYGAAITWNHPR